MTLTGEGQKSYFTGELAQLVDGIIIGDSSIKINNVSTIQESTQKSITFAENKEKLEEAEKSPAAVIIIPEGIAEKRLKKIDKTLMKVDNPRLAYAEISNLFAPSPYFNPGIHSEAILADSVEVGKKVSIHANVVIETGAKIGDNVILAPGVYVGENVKIGNKTVIHPGAVIEYDSIIGSEVIIHAGTVIGVDGYGFVENKEGEPQKISQLGNVVIEDNVEIGANATIERATSGSTVIKNGSKIGSLVEIAHNSEIGENNLIVPQTGIAGSSKTGENVQIGGQAAVIDHVKVGDNIKLATNAVVTKDILNEGFYSGNPAREHKKELKQKALNRKLPELIKKIKNLEEKIQNLEVKNQ